MKIYWSLRDVPELARLPSAERRRVHEACLRRHFWHSPVNRTSLTAYLMLIICPVALVGITSWLVEAFGGTISTWLMIPTIVAGGSLGHFVFSRIATCHLRHFYLNYIENDPKSAGD